MLVVTRFLETCEAVSKSDFGLENYEHRVIDVLAEGGSSKKSRP